MVKDGTHTAKIALLGNYLSAHFVPSAVAGGGVAIVDPPQQALLARPHAA